MRAIHPYVHRIRTEREVLGLINGRKAIFENELSGLSTEAVESWYERMPIEIKTFDSVIKLKDKIRSIGLLTKLSSNGSHRGAMIAPMSNDEIAAKLIGELKFMLEELPVRR